MNSETYVLGYPIAEKPAIGARVRAFAATLGPGSVLALVYRKGDGIGVREALACPLTAPEYDITKALEAHLNGA
jgi:hypothetical protein